MPYRKMLNLTTSMRRTFSCTRTRTAKSDGRRRYHYYLWYLYAISSETS
jgi:hypothetical protein